MVCDREAFGFGNRMLAFFNFSIKKLLYLAAIEADQMVVVLAFVEFVNRFTRFKMVTAQNACLFELGQHAVNRCQSNIGAFLEQHAKHVLGCHMPLAAGLENLHDFQARQRGFEASAFKFVDIGHGRRDGRNRYNDSIITFAPGLHTRQSAMRVFVSPFHHRPVVLWSARCALAAGLCTLLAACGALDSGSVRVASIVTPYKAEVVQGNFVSKEQVEFLTAGMTRAQVKDVLGSPLITSAFHADRWDYVFTIRRQGIEAQSRKITVFFKGELFDRVEGDTLPTEAEFVSTLDNRRTLGKVPVLVLPQDKLDALQSKQGSASKPSTPPTAAATSGAPVAHPPLEPVNR